MAAAVEVHQQPVPGPAGTVQRHPGWLLRRSDEHDTPMGQLIGYLVACGDASDDPPSAPRQPQRPIPRGEIVQFGHVRPKNGSVSPSPSLPETESQKWPSWGDCVLVETSRSWIRRSCSVGGRSGP